MGNKISYFADLVNEEYGDEGISCYADDTGIYFAGKLVIVTVTDYNIEDYSDNTWCVAMNRFEIETKPHFDIYEFESIKDELDTIFEIVADSDGFVLQM